MEAERALGRATQEEAQRAAVELETAREEWQRERGRLMRMNQVWGREEGERERERGLMGGGGKRGTRVAWC